MVVENQHLLKTITHIIPHQSGSVLLDGKDISKEDTKALAKNGHTGTSDYKYRLIDTLSGGQRQRV